MKYQEFKTRLEALINQYTGGNVAQFSKDTDIPRSSLKNWLSGEYLPDAVNCLKLKEKCNISIDELLTGVKLGTLTDEQEEVLEYMADKLFQQFLAMYRKYKTVKEKHEITAVNEMMNCALGLIEKIESSKKKENFI